IGFSDELNNTGLSEDVLAHQPMVERYASEYDISEHVPILLAIIAVESGGTAEDVMQSSESLGLSPNSLGTEESIEQGTKYFAEQLQAAEEKKVDTKTAIKSYNFGAGLIDYMGRNGKAYSFEWAESLRKNVQVEIKSPIAIPLP